MYLLYLTNYDDRCHGFKCPLMKNEVTKPQLKYSSDKSGRKIRKIENNDGT